VFRTTQLLAFLVLPALLQASLGGFVASSAMILWAIFIPLAALAYRGCCARSRGLWRFSRSWSCAGQSGRDHQGLVFCADRVRRVATAVDDAKDSSSKIITWR
jgi:hypothetical protein